MSFIFFFVRSHKLSQPQQQPRQSQWGAGISAEVQGACSLLHDSRQCQKQGSVRLLRLHGLHSAETAGGQPHSCQLLLQSAEQPRGWEEGSKYSLLKFILLLQSNGKKIWVYEICKWFNCVFTLYTTSHLSQNQGLRQRRGLRSRAFCRGVVVVFFSEGYLCELCLQLQGNTSAQVQPQGEEEEEDSVAWVNAALRRLFWDFLTEPYWAEVVSKKIQMKLSKIRVSVTRPGTNWTSFYFLFCFLNRT